MAVPSLLELFLRAHPEQWAGAVVAQAGNPMLQNEMSDAGPLIAPHWVSSVTDVIDHFRHVSYAWLSQQTPFMVVREAELELSLEQVAQRLHEESGWRAIQGPDELVALHREARLLVHAETRGHERERWGDWDDDVEPAFRCDRVLIMRLAGSSDDVNRWLQPYREIRARARPLIRWRYSADEGDVPMPIREDRVPHPLMFPFLPKPLFEFYDAYQASDAPVLLLVGPPGTGKTSFIRGFLQHTRQSAMMTFDADILRRDDLFARFLASDTPAFVLEDADVHLRARASSDDASMMHRFLSVSDGLVSVRDKKLIFSTNLPNVRDVDEALLRPGRCFAVVHFRALQPQEGRALGRALGWSQLPKDGQARTLAQWFALQKASFVEEPGSPVGGGIGFV